MKAVLLGSGKDAIAFAKMLQMAENYPENNGITVNGIICRDASQTAKIATLLGIKAFAFIEDALRNADVLLISQHEDKLAAYSEYLKTFHIRNRILCHFSTKYDSSVIACGSTNSSYSIFMPYKFENEKISQLVKTLVVIEGDGRHTEEFCRALSNSLSNFKFCSKDERLMALMSRRVAHDYLKTVIVEMKKMYKAAGIFDDAALSLMCSHLGEELYRTEGVAQPLTPAEIKKNMRVLSAVNYSGTGEYVRNMETYITKEGALPLENQEHLLFEMDTIIASLNEYRQAIAEDDHSRLIALLDDGRKRKEEVDGH